MKRETFERLTLLEASGEISEPEKRALQVYIEKNTGARDFRAQQAILMSEAQSALSTESPHPSVRVRIRGAAESRISRGRIPSPSPLAIRGMACAAALMVLLAAWSMVSKESRAGRILEIRGLMAAASASTSEGVPAGAGNGLDLQELGRQLLQMQGLAMDESDGAGFEDAPPSPGEELPPTASQENKMHVSLQKKYV